MSNAQHTPGPWFSQYDDNGFYEIGSESVSLRLAFTYGEGETDEANARLIAAAPELLAALQLISQWREVIAKSEIPAKSAILEDFDDARAAIAKANGE